MTDAQNAPSGPTIVWFRRDLRVHDLPTLLAAADDAPDAVGLFVLDDRLLGPAGAARRAFLAGCLAALDRSIGGRLVVTAGDPAVVVPDLARHVGARAVHISADHGPYGTRRDRSVADALGAVPLVATGSPYAVTPGRVRKPDGDPYSVFTPFSRAWLRHGWRPPAETDADTVSWLSIDDAPHRTALPDAPPCAAELPTPGEEAARTRWRAFVADDLDDYAGHRDRPDLDGTTRLSPYLKFGCLHPRTLLHDLRDRSGDGVTRLRTELAWRDFYADVLDRRPDTARRNVDRRFDRLDVDTDAHAREAFTAWCEGRTGVPIVDAGMRQLLAEGWMHNRLRMITASFVTKDLHVPWQWGARHFLRHLVDGDLASNQHGWQWTAGCGTDAAPFFRVFNPYLQGERFDPEGDYVRRWVPELRSVPGASVHRLRGGRPERYPAPIVEHDHERKEALVRYRSLR